MPAKTPETRHYVRRQLAVGPNCGKWCVFTPAGRRVAVGESKKQALTICGAFTLAAQVLRASGRGDLASEVSASVTTPGYTGRVYPIFRCRKRRES